MSARAGRVRGRGIYSRVVRPEALEPHNSGVDLPSRHLILRTEIRDFLIPRRARIAPEDAGLPAYGEPQSVRPTCVNRGLFGAENAKVLEYNTSITFNGFTCYPRIEAMICDAGGGHGFVLSIQQATSN